MSLDELPDWLPAWCLDRLGSEPAEELFGLQRISTVFGLRLTDGTDIVIKARADDGRISGDRTDDGVVVEARTGRAASCVAAQALLAERGYPCARPLTPVDALGPLAVHAEEYRPGGEMLHGHSPDVAVAYAKVFARLMAELADVTVAPPLPNPRWVRWDHQDPGVWPALDLLDARDQSAVPARVVDVAVRVRERILAAALPCVLGYADFEAQNLRWNGGRLWAVHDWDSLAWQPEAALVGAASGMFANAGPPTLAPIESSEAFLWAYQETRRRRFTTAELEVAWAASLWPAAHNARWEALHGTDPLSGDALQAQATERLRRANVRFVGSNRSMPPGPATRIPAMEQRMLGRTGRQVGAVGFGAWQIGGAWGTVDEDDALTALRASVDAGVTFVDTADVYGDGRSERLVGRLLTEHPDLTVATKMGRRAEQLPENYTLANFRAWNDRSRTNLGVDTIDLVQLHCPPTPVYSNDAVYDALDTLVSEGRIAAYGVSVETTEEALTAIERPGVATVQIILNAFRHKPMERVLPAAAAAGVGIIARVPLASGLLTGKLTARSSFAADDHRTFNRQGDAFDVGETFAGVDFETGLAAVERLRGVVPASMTMTQFALRWILDQPGVSVVIPGARNAEQARGNATAAELPPLTTEQHAAVTEVYDELIRPRVHHRW